jgi:hypothetical protein
MLSGPGTLVAMEGASLIEPQVIILSLHFLFSFSPVGLPGLFSV